MLNIPLIQQSMQQRGLTRTALATACEVSKEAVSNWLSGQSLPRPRKLLRLAEILHIEVTQLMAPDDEPVIAFRTTGGQHASDAAREAAVTAAEHLQELLPHLPHPRLFSPAVLDSPSLEEAYLLEATRQVRDRLGLADDAPVQRAELLSLVRDFGAIMVPVYWNRQRHGHENALSIYLPRSKTTWVFVNLHASIGSFNAWLAHELGHCYTLHRLSAEEGELFAERFAQALLFPPAAAARAAAELATVSGDEALRLLAWYAGKYEVPMPTIVARVDLWLAQQGRKVSGFKRKLRGCDVHGEGRQETLSVSTVLFGAQQLPAEHYIRTTSDFFRTPVFEALACWQRRQGGGSPAFVASALNVDIGQAVEISFALSPASGMLAS
ncbi:helix-turn-helix domain-containing protein [Herbaspirillum huttiense]|uniref:helix-turn-helix domain-containing protein n=1 Tax=Herbaspirillum huttiense TaxID=863372 RepID=UPI0039B0A488